MLTLRCSAIRDLGFGAHPTTRLPLHGTSLLPQSLEQPLQIVVGTPKHGGDAGLLGGDDDVRVAAGAAVEYAKRTYLAAPDHASRDRWARALQAAARGEPVRGCSVQDCGPSAPETQVAVKSWCPSTA